MDPLGVSQVLPSKSEIVTHARSRSDDVRAPPPTPAKDVNAFSPLNPSSTISARSNHALPSSSSVPQWPASPAPAQSPDHQSPSSAASTMQTRYSISSPYSGQLQQQQQTPASSSSLSFQQQQRIPSGNSPGLPRSPVIREAGFHNRNGTQGIDSGDDRLAAGPSSSATRNQRQYQSEIATSQNHAQQAAVARARNGLQQNQDLQANLEAMREKDRVEGYVRIRVTGLERNKKDLWVKMEAATNLSTYHQTNVKPFSRSYGELIALHLALASNHPEIIIPAIPLMETAAANAEEEERLLRAAFQKWVDRISRDRVLSRDDELRSFLEAHFGYTPVTIRRRLKPSSSFASLSLRASKPSLEADDDMARTKGDMAQLENQFSDVARAIDKVGRNRKMLAGALFDVSEQLSAFSTLETHKPLQIGFQKMAEGTRRLGDIDSGLATAESVTLADALAYSSAEAKEAKDALLQRQLIVDEHRTASKSAINKKRQIEKLKSSNNIKPERADEALEDFEDAKKHETVLAAKVDAVSERLAPSLAAHTRQMHEDLFEALLVHARTGLAFEKQALKDLEALRPDINDIPAKTAAEIVYIHQPSTSDIASPPLSTSSSNQVSPAHSRNGSLANNPLSPPIQNQSRIRQDGTQSMYVPPTHHRAVAQQNSPSTTASRINDLAKSVYLPGGGEAKGKDKIVDERRRVDARSAAAKLANGF